MSSSLNEEAVQEKKPFESQAFVFDAVWDIFTDYAFHVLQCMRLGKRWLGWGMGDGEKEKEEIYSEECIRDQ